MRRNAYRFNELSKQQKERVLNGFKSLPFARNDVLRILATSNPIMIGYESKFIQIEFLETFIADCIKAHGATITKIEA